MDIRERLARYCVAAAQPYCENFKYKPIIGSNFLGINSACANARGVFVFFAFFRLALFRAHKAIFCRAAAETALYGFGNIANSDFYNCKN